MSAVRSVELERIATLPAGERLALRKGDAAKAMSISDEAFQKHVVPYVPAVRLGSVRLYQVAALQRFLDTHAHLPLEDQ